MRENYSHNAALEQREEAASVQLPTRFLPAVSASAGACGLEAVH